MTLDDFLATVEPESVAARNRVDESRTVFSVRCWRGWCDPQFQRRDLARMTAVFTGQMERLPTLRPRDRTCLTPGCQCVCHEPVNRTAGG